MSYKIELQENGKYRVRAWGKKDIFGKTQTKQVSNISGLTTAKKLALELEYEVKGDFIDITFNKLDDLRFEERKNKLSPTTLNTVYKLDRNIARTYFGKVKVKDITTRALQKFIDEYQNKGLKKKTVKNYVTYILSVINWGVNYDYISSNNIKKLNYKEDEEEFESTTLELEEIATILKDLKTNYYNLYIPTLIAVMTGARRGEVLGLTWENIDFENNIIYFKNNMITTNGKSYLKKSLKTKSSKRAIPLSNFLKEELLEHKNNYFPDIQVCSNLFLNEIKPDYFTHKFHDYLLSKHNINMREHDLRHTFSQLIRDNEELIINKSKIMGHSDIQITKNIYTRNSINQNMFNMVNSLGDEIKRLMCN
ncbi:MAG: site-specific integrase [Clostridia bacterium]|nr:site-specific integrase [Clostridia bacterium]